MRMLRAVLLAKAVLVSLLALSSPPLAEAAVFVEYVGDPDHPDTCLIEDKGIRVKDGHTWDLPDCMKAYCSGSGEDMVIEYYTCPSVSVPASCVNIPAPSKPYPECCGTVFCPPRPRAERRAALQP